MRQSKPYPQGVRTSEAVCAAGLDTRKLSELDAACTAPHLWTAGLLLLRLLLLLLFLQALKRQDELRRGRPPRNVGVDAGLYERRRRLAALLRNSDASVAHQKTHVKMRTVSCSTSQCAVPLPRFWSLYQLHAPSAPTWQGCKAENTRQQCEDSPHGGANWDLASDKLPNNDAECIAVRLQDTLSGLQLVAGCASEESADVKINGRLVSGIVTSGCLSLMRRCWAPLQ